MAQYHKNLGNDGENIAHDDYVQRGYQLIQRNFTMPGGELDLIFHDVSTLVFVEVKTVNHIDELHGYVTQKKLHYLQKTIDYFLLKHGGDYATFDIRLDVVFVQHGTILELFENVYG